MCLFTLYIFIDGSILSLLMISLLYIVLFYLVLVCSIFFFFFFFFSSRRRHTRFDCDWSSDVCSSDLRTLGVILYSYYSILCTFFHYLVKPAIIYMKFIYAFLILYPQVKQESKS